MRVDEYFWLRDDGREDSEVLAHLQAENAWYDHVMAPTLPLQDRLFEEIIGRLDPEESGVPYEKGGYWYYHRFEAGKEYAIHARRRGDMDSAEAILVDGNRRAEGQAFYRLANLELSDDQRFVALAEDTTGNGLCEIRIWDTGRGGFLPEVIARAGASLAWSADGEFLFYLDKHPQTLLAYRLMRHRRGTDPAEDVLVYEEQDASFYNAVWRSRSGEYLMLGHHSTDTTEVQLLAADDPLGTFRPFLPREAGHEYDVDHANGLFFVRTNWAAPDFRVMQTASAACEDRGEWRELVPARMDAMVTEIVAFDDWLVVGERIEGLSRVRVMSHDGQADRYIDLPEEVGVMWPTGNHRTDTSRLRYGYSSLTTPDQTWEIDLTNGEQTLLKAQHVPGGYDRSNYRTGRMEVEVHDGQHVPVSFVRHRDTALDGTAPALVYGYGAYGLPVEPLFRNPVISLLDRGFVYCIAHIRGGEEKGRAWYDGGRLQNKANTFSDFIEVTRYLQDKRMVDSTRTYAMGGSAGGLLMAVVMNLAPDLFHGVVAAVPFVDVLTTMQDESIPLTTGEYREWGDPANAEDYLRILSWSPYDQVTALDYPHLLVSTGLHDAQVQYWEPVKWVARLRERRTNEAKLILRIQMDAGHHGLSGRYRQYRDTAEEYAFLLDLAGIGN